MTTLAAAGTTFRVMMDGPANAPCLVFANSLGATLEMWQPQVAALAGRWRLLRFDTRGHGSSGVTPGPYSIERLGRDVLALMDASGIERASFCGLSMGGATGLWLAAHAPERFDRLVICNTLPWLGPPEAMLTRAATVRREGLGGLAEATMERWFTPGFRAGSPEVVAAVRAAFRATPVEGYAACCEALASYDERGSIARIAKPVLVVAGTHDPAPPIAAVREYAPRIPGAKLVELPAAHLSNLGAAREFNMAVGAFLGPSG